MPNQVASNTRTATAQHAQFTRGVAASSTLLHWKEFDAKQDAEYINNGHALLLLCPAYEDHQSTAEERSKTEERSGKRSPLMPLVDRLTALIDTAMRGALAELSKGSGGGGWFPAAVLGHNSSSSSSNAPIRAFTFTTPANILTAQRCLAVHGRCPCLVYHIGDDDSSKQEEAVQETSDQGKPKQKMTPEEATTSATSAAPPKGESSFVIDFAFPIPTPLNPCFIGYCNACSSNNSVEYHVEEKNTISAPPLQLEDEEEGEAERGSAPFSSSSSSRVIPINRSVSAIKTFFYRVASGVQRVAPQGEKPPAFYHFQPSTNSHGVVLLEGKAAVTGTLMRFLPLPPPPPTHCQSWRGGALITPPQQQQRTSYSRPASFSLSWTGHTAGAPPPPPPPPSLHRRYRDHENILGSLGVLWSHQCPCCPMALMMLEQLVALLRGVAQGLWMAYQQTLPPLQRRVASSIASSFPGNAEQQRCHPAASTPLPGDGDRRRGEEEEAVGGPSTPQPQQRLLQSIFTVDDDDDRGDGDVKHRLEELELFRFFVMNIADNDVPLIDNVWPAGDDEERTVPSIVAYAPLPLHTTADDTAEGRRHCPSSDNSKIDLDRCRQQRGDAEECELDAEGDAEGEGEVPFFDCLGQLAHLQSCVYKGEKDAELLLSFITSHCLPPTPPPSLSFMNAYTPCCLDSEIKRREEEEVNTCSPVDSPTTSNAPSASPSSWDWRDGLRRLCVEALEFEFVESGALLALADVDSQAYRHAILMSRQVEKLKPMRQRQQQQSGGGARFAREEGGGRGGGIGEREESREEQRQALEAERKQFERSELESTLLHMEAKHCARTSVHISPPPHKMTATDNSSKNSTINDNNNSSNSIHNRNFSSIYTNEGDGMGAAELEACQTLLEALRAVRAELPDLRSLGREYVLKKATDRLEGDDAGDGGFNNNNDNAAPPERCCASAASSSTSAPCGRPMLMFKLFPNLLDSCLFKRPREE